MMIFRHHYDRYGWGFRGGYTIAIDTDRRTVGISLCSCKDQFDKKLGRGIATQRALDVAGDGNIFVVSAPAAKSAKSTGDLRDAVEHVMDYIMYKFPNAEFGFTFN